MKAANPWITYRTRFLVQAKQLTTSLTFTDTLGRQHSGCKGDYLVESSNGSFGIAPRQIFEDVYVPLETPSSTHPESQPHQGTASAAPFATRTLSSLHALHTSHGREI